MFVLASGELISPPLMIWVMSVGFFVFFWGGGMVSLDGSC